MSSKLNNETLDCIIRKIPVKATPEEQVRQHLLQWMTQELGYPSSLISVEQDLRKLPHLLSSKIKIPNRRADILVFGKGVHPDYDLFPLLLIECKAVKLSQEVINQVIGYNHHVQARYFAVANAERCRTGWWSEGEYHYIPTLPDYAQIS